ncbi:MAG: S-layer homology domain-containing protein [Clostridia bacterium]|nr:S-layer homology domain-containing protein [Clostridia bacterium]
MKRIIASLLAFSMMFSFWTFAHAENEETSYSDAMNLMYDLGIVTGYEDGSLRPDNNITRMEFVTMALRLMGHYNVDESYAENNIFEDVTGDLWGAKNINLSHQLGLVDGHTDTIFAPNDNVTVNQAAKVIICILGYKTIAEKEGYPNGYVSIGTDLSLFDNVGIGERPATRDDVAKLMANALDANMMKAKYQADGTVDYVESDKTLLEEMGIEKRRGVVYSVPGIDIGTGRSLEENQVIVGDTLYETTKTAIYDEIGSELEIWVVTETESFVPAIVHYEKRPTETELTIPAYSISPATTASEFVYLNESNDKKTISLSDKTIFIYNGQLLTTGQVTADKLKPAMGYVVLKNYKNSEFPVVMIWSFENYVVKTVKNGAVIYDTFGKKLEIDEDKTKTVLLDNQAISLENIEAGDILSVAVSPNGESYRIYVSRDFMDGTIEKVRTNSDKEIIYTIGGADYYVAGNYQKYVEENSTKVKELYTGDHTTFYFDYFGNIAYTDAVYELPSIKYGYVVDAEYDNIEEVLYVELMNDSNSFERFRVDPDEGSKIGVFKNGSYTINKKNLTAVCNELIKDYGIKRQLVKYNPSADGLLREFYLLDTSGTSDIWGKSKGNKTSMTYANGTLDGEYTIDANTIAFYIPNTGNDTELFKSGRAVTLISSSASKVQLYDIIDNRVGVVILCGDEKGTTGYKYIIDMTNDPIMLVEEIATHVVDDEEVVYMSGWQDGKQVTVNFSKTLEKNSEDISTIAPGMLVQYKLNSDTRSRAETSDEPSRVILFRKIMDMNQQFEPYQTWNMKNDWMASAQLRYAYGTVKSYSMPNMVLDCGEGEHHLAALSIDDSVNVIRWNRQENRGERVTIYDVLVNDMILVRTRHNVTKDIYIFE